MAPRNGSYCLCQECLDCGEVDGNNIRIGRFWTAAQKLAHRKRIQMRQDPAAIAEAAEHSALSRHSRAIPDDAAIANLSAGLNQLQIGSPSIVENPSIGVPSFEGRVPSIDRRGDKRGDKRERSRLTSKAHTLLTGVQTRITRCLEKLEYNPSIESFQFVDQELPQLTRALTSVKRNVDSVVSRKSQVEHELKRLKDQFTALNAGIYTVPPPLIDKSPLRFVTDQYFDQPINGYTPLTQITLLTAVMSMVFMGVSRAMGDLLLNMLLLLLSLFSDDTSSLRKVRLATKQIPRTIKIALEKFKLEPDVITYAVCPSCHCTYRPEGPSGSTACYPAVCSNRPKPGSDVCGTSLVEADDEDGLNVKPRKTFIYHPFHNYVAGLLSQKHLEELMDKASDDMVSQVEPGKAPPFMTDVFDAEFARNFEGPTTGKLFLDRPGNEGRYLFAFNFDFFSAEGQTIRGPTASCGIISAVCLNLPLHLRYKPENMYIAGIIPGPTEPHKTEINHYSRIIVDDLLLSWERGVYYTRTAKYTDGRPAKCAMALAVNDLPAARQLSQWAHFSSHHFCSRCHCFHLTTLGRCDTASRDWRPKDKAKLRQMAEAWRDAASVAEQEALFKKNGIRWSELWRLPYWDQANMLVVDSMHCLLEGLAQFHFREVLQFRDVAAQAREDPGVAFQLSQPSPTELYVKAKKLSVNDLKHIPHIYGYLVAPINEDPTIDDLAFGTTFAALAKRLETKNLKALQFVCEILNLIPTGRKIKKAYIELLLNWRSMQPMGAMVAPIRLGTMSMMDHIRSVIHDTDVPSWIPSVPHNFGKAAAGSLKADEWRTMATIYLPIALISAWGKGSAHPSAAVATKCRKSLDHTMALVSAILVACKRTLTKARMDSYLSYMTFWVHELAILHPDVKPRVNGHMALHIFDYMKLFGPVHSWWSFPFERLVGHLQRLPGNHKFGQLEGTMLKSYYKSAQLKQWLARPDCPEIISESKTLFDKAFATGKEHANKTPTSFSAPPLSLRHLVSSQQVALLARYRFDTLVFSRASTHVGNSLILYFPSGNMDLELVPASIAYIVAQKQGKVVFLVREQKSAPPGAIDPFEPYPELFAKVHSTELSDELKLVEPDWVFSHYARWNLDHERAVVMSLSRD